MATRKDEKDTADRPTEANPAEQAGSGGNGSSDAIHHADEAGRLSAEAGRQATEAGRQAATEAGRQATEVGRQAAEAGRQGIERTRKAAVETSEATLQAGNRAAERGVQQAAELSRRGGEQMRSLVTASAQVYRDMTDFSKGDVDAMMQTSARLAKSVQDVSMEVMQYTQMSLRMGLQVANEMMTCRSVEDFMQVQRNFLQESVDSFLQESARLLEISSHAASETITPLTEHPRTEGHTRH